MFLAARISYIRFFSAVHIYEYHIYKFIIHHSDGLFGPNILTSSQLACVTQLVEHCTGIAEVMGSIPYGPEFFSGLVSATRSVEFLAAKISYIRFFTAKF